ncbi:hypothetical protein PHMEG_0003231 [Phytophthora megakarya]|uniref:Uncharacterized protein n=1 Tax=Phytophthora megakarya TaxID=4795 RepID=A0A225WWJ2_9STRA|nr:hypothetical protein PHMEG_0003231 [Phytophthora megakarya]
MTLVPKAKANILSEFWLKQRGGGYKFVLWRHKLGFVAIEVNGAYYIQSHTLRDRQIYCPAVKARPAKALHVPGHTRVEATLKEWHIKLCHLNRDKLIEVMSCYLIPGIVPNFSRNMLRKVSNMYRTEDEKDEQSEQSW